MAYGNVKYVGDGSTKVFSIPFPYLDITHVKVYVNGVLQNNVTYPTESQVELPVAPAEGAIVAVVRETPKERIVDFQNASILDEKTLDLDSNQMMYIVQESLDKSEEALVVDVDNAYDAQGRRIKNLADPQDDQDAVTKHFADQVLAQAQANADAARASAQAAQVAESNAKSHRDTALTAANQAVTEVNNAINNIRDEGDTQVARTIHEGDTQVARVQAEGNIQIANAKQQADRAENEANRAKTIADSLDIEDDFYAHLADTNNPHSVTAAQVPYTSSIYDWAPGDVAAGLDVLAGSRIVDHNFDVVNPPNGYYVRWENGLQLCWTSIGGWGVQEGNKEDDIWVFPAVFRERPYVVGFPASYNQHPVLFWSRQRRSDESEVPFNASQVPISRYHLGTPNNYMRVHLLAIGRWK